jgi:ABC-type amino acid transport substrate-binding protein
MTLKKIIILFCLLPFCILANTSLEIGDVSSKQERITLTVAVEEIGYFPYNYEENGEIKGFTIGVLDYIKTHSKYDFEFIIIPWARALYLLEQGEIDLILTLFKNKKREQIYHFIEPSYGYEVNQLFTLKDTKFEFTGELQQLTPYSIGTKRKFSYGETFDRASYLKKLPALTEAALLKLLLSNQIDMAIANPYIFNQLISKNNVTSKVRSIEPYVAKTPVYLGLTKGRDDSQEIKETFGKITEQLKSSYYYQELLNKYRLNF